MSMTERSILDDMVTEVLNKGLFNPETDKLSTLYDMLSKELPKH